MYFDTHAHYDSGAFNADRFEILGSMPDAKVGLIVNPGCDLESSKTAIGLAERFNFVYAAVGWHPEDMDKLTDKAFAELEMLAEHPKCLAIGEIGLDYYWDDTHKAEQKELFKKQIELAIRLNKPVIVHDREAHGDSLEGPITYKNARKAIEVLEFCPLDKIVIETDSPYLTPVPNRGKRNDSRQLEFVVNKIAEIKGINADEVENITFENDKKLFGIGE